MFKILGIITKYIIMSEESISQELNLKNKEINRNESMSKKRKKVCRVLNYIEHLFCRVLNYIEHLFIFISSVTGCVFISAFASLVDISVGIANSAVGLNICVITAGN